MKRYVNAGTGNRLLPQVMSRMQHCSMLAPRAAHSAARRTLDNKLPTGLHAGGKSKGCEANFLSFRAAEIAPASEYFNLRLFTVQASTLMPC